MKKILHAFSIATMLCFSFNTSAQLIENFNDGNFTNNPTWAGNTADWIINPALQLQSNNTVANSNFYLSTASTLATTAQWDWYTKLEFNPSGPNSVDVYLTASASDLGNANTTGYFVRIGNTDDEIALYKKDAGGVAIKLIDGANGVLNNSLNVMRIRVIRNAANQWTLLRDLSGSGTTYVSEGSVTDASYTNSSFFGIFVRQSTSTFFQKHYFDDIEIKTFAPDLTPPTIVSATAISLNTVDVTFNEPVDLATAQNPANYSANNGIGNPATAVRDASNTSLVRLTFTNNFPSGPVHTLIINNVRDLAGNPIVNGTVAFSFYVVKRFDIVIDEIMADPSPQVALPNTEWIELKNTSGRALNLQGWRITTSSSTSGIFPNYVLPADSFLVITNSLQVSFFSPFIRILGVSFPSLTNEGATVSLISREGVTIHSVSYSDEWYKNTVKKEGGWTLEMIDPRNACNGENNWRASIDLRGGTPGAKNSIDAANADVLAPAVVRAAATDSVTIMITFSETIDSARGATAANYVITGGASNPIVVSAVAIAPLFQRAQIKLSAPLLRGTVYTITVNGITDCSGNTISSANNTRFGLPGPIDSFGIIINEVLFNPPTNGVDYVEIYNRTGNVYDLKDLYINNRTTSGALATPKQVSTDNLLLFPGQYFVLTSSASTVKSQFIALNPDNFIDIVSFPSYSNDKGNVVLMNAQGNIVDELAYLDDWHFALLDNEKGVALERIDFNKPTQNRNNWHSAASTVGYGTPSYKNSQLRADAVVVQGEVSTTPKTFSPNNDGFEDFTIINYKLADPGYVGNITIFDASGRPVRVLAKNATLGLNGTFRWDGLNDKQQRVPIGAYVIFTEAFNLDGKKRTFKNTVVVAAKF